MLNRISVRLSASILGLLALIVATAVATGYYLAHYRGDVQGADLALRQATRATSVGLEAVNLASGSDPAARTRLIRLTELRQEFERTHEALTNGGLRSAPALARLDLAKTQWDRMTKALDELLASGGKSDEARRTVLETDLEVCSNLEAAASILKSHADEEVAQLFWIQASTVSAGLILVLFILWGSRREIGLPLERLVRAAKRMSGGDLATPIDTSGLTEIADLAQSFERLRVSLATGAEPPSTNPAHGGALRTKPGSQRLVTRPTGAS